jgi:hypothetical protein
VLNEGNERLKWLGERRNAADGRAVGVHAVVGVRSTHDDLLAGPADRAPVCAYQLRRGVDGIGSTARSEEDLGVCDRHERRDTLGQHFGRLVGKPLVGLVGRKLAHLGRGCLRDLGAAVTDIDVPEASDGIQIRAAGTVIYRRALAPDDRHDVARRGGHVRERVPQDGPAGPCGC